jgi:uncharacterized membrane protein YkoI
MTIATTGRILGVLSIITLLIACHRKEPMPARDAQSSQLISREQAISIAERDARKAYRDLSPFKVEAMRKEDGWHVDFMLKDEYADGGGPHYLIDAKDGRIIRKRYEQ